MKKHIILSLPLLVSASVLVSAAPPVVKIETKEVKGKKVEYKYINGIKVHETDPAKQPQPKVVAPKPYDAKAAKAPANAIILFRRHGKDIPKLDIHQG